MVEHPPVTIIYQISEDFPTCLICNLELDWVECPECWGTGEIDDNDIEYLDYDSIICPSCAGEGGWFECLNAEQHPVNSEE